MVIYEVVSSQGLDDTVEGTVFCRTYKECVVIRDEIFASEGKDTDVRIEQVELAKLPAVELALAMLNRQGYAKESRQLWPKLKVGEGQGETFDQAMRRAKAAGVTKVVGLAD